jgi:glyoxylase-like metal-dependent hydrolase (beta-lactamase superfamily II)
VAVRVVRNEGGLTVTYNIGSVDQVPFSSTGLLVTPVPGHTPWCILIHDERNDFGFTGDFLLYEISSNPLIQRPALVPEGYGSLKAYISSLKKVSEIGLGIALPGHGKIIEHPKKRIGSLLAFIEERKVLIHNILLEGPLTPFQLLQKVFPDLNRDELFLAVSEVMGYLEVLESEGKVTRSEGPLIRFSPR